MIFRSLDSSGDWNFGRGKQSFLTENSAIAMNIKTRLLQVYGECFFDAEAGIPVFDLIGGRSKADAYTLAAKNIIAKSEGVVRINSVEATLTNRKLSLTYNIDTIYTQNYSGVV